MDYDKASYILFLEKYTEMCTHYHNTLRASGNDVFHKIKDLNIIHLFNIMHQFSTGFYHACP